MGLHKIKKGLDLPIQGEPVQEVSDGEAVSAVALVADDYAGMKPTMLVGEGDEVQRGQALFADKKTEGVVYTSPGAGRVAEVNRGDRRAFQSIVIELDDAEKGGEGSSVSFENYSGRAVGELSGDEVRALLIESGMWPVLRARPFGKVAEPASTPKSIFVTAMDSNPLAPDVDIALAGHEEDFAIGLEALGKLTEGTVYVCKNPDSAVPVPSGGKFATEEFVGPHPAGTAGVHIHFLDPVDRKKLVWHVGYANVAAIGHVFRTGALGLERVVALAGPAVANPRLIRTRVGAKLSELAAADLPDDDVRLISGSVLSGRTAVGPLDYLGRHHNQISALLEGRERELLGWLGPGFTKFSTISAYASKLLPGAKFSFTTSTNGSDRAIVPIGMYENVMPMDILPTFLLKALVVGDVEYAEQLGVLELEEEDLALCTFVCPGKTEYGPLLRNLLTKIEKEG